jgi:hypothetical protein
MEATMKKVMAISTLLFLGLLLAAQPSDAGQANDGNQVAKILELKSSLSLTDSQVKKLEQVQKNAQARMNEAWSQSQIRLAEIERFSSDWTNMNSVAVMSLIKEYFKFLTDYKTAELEAVIQARSILAMDQLRKFQQLVSIESLMISMENQLAAR